MAISLPTSPVYERYPNPVDLAIDATGANFIAGFAATGGDTANSATFGGNAMTLEHESAGPAGRITREWSYINALSGSQTFAIGGTPNAKTLLWLLAIAGAHATTPVRDKDEVDTGANATHGEITLTTESGDLCILCIMNTASGSDPQAADGETLLPTGSPNGGNWDDLSRCILAYKTATGTSTTVGVTWTPTGNREWTAVGMAIQPAAGGGGASIAAISAGYHIRGINRMQRMWQSWKRNKAGLLVPAYT